MSNSYLDDKVLRDSVEKVALLDKIFTATQRSVLKSIVVEDYRSNKISVDMRSWDEPIDQYIIAHKVGFALSQTTVLKERVGFSMEAVLSDNTNMFVRMDEAGILSFSGGSIRYIGPVLKQILTNTVKDVSDIVKSGSNADGHSELYRCLKKQYDAHITEELKEALETSIYLAGIDIDKKVNRIAAILYL